MEMAKKETNSAGMRIIDCVYCVWKKGNLLRECTKLKEHNEDTRVILDE